MLKLYGKKDKKLTVDLSTVNELKENDKILIASNGKMKQIDGSLIDFNGGGGSTPDGPTFNDGKTRLFITVASMDRPVIAFYVGCTVVGGVTIDWGDGSETEVTTNTVRTRYSHTYSAAGDYIIALEVTDGELVLEGDYDWDSDNYQSIMDSNWGDESVPYSMPYITYSLRMVELGNNVIINAGAFIYCYTLTHVTIQEGVTSIGERAFSNCYALTSINIPSSVTSIGKSAFDNCYSLTSVTIQEGVTSIGDNAFQYCTALKSVIIPSSVASIGDNAFDGCRSLTSVSILEGVTSIGSCAFSNCDILTSINIPSSVTNIEYGVFQGCHALTSVIIPEGVTSIGDDAFRNCTSLISVTIPSSVTSIGEYAFSACISMGRMNLLSLNPPELANGSLDSIPDDCKIYIPVGSMEAYSSALGGWNYYSSMLVEE